MVNKILRILSISDLFRLLTKKCISVRQLFLGSADLFLICLLPMCANKCFNILYKVIGKIWISSFCNFPVACLVFMNGDTSLQQNHHQSYNKQISGFKPPKCIAFMSNVRIWVASNVMLANSHVMLSMWGGTFTVEVIYPVGFVIADYWSFKMEEGNNFTGNKNQPWKRGMYHQLLAEDICEFAGQQRAQLSLPGHSKIFTIYDKGCW